MSGRLLPALIAVGASLVLAVLLLAPFVAISYRRRGTLQFRWLAGWFALLLYLAGLLAYTMLPLPLPGSYQCATPVLDPIVGFANVLKYPVGGPRQLLANPALQQLVLNVVLFLPLGVFAKLMFRRGILATVALGAAASLTIETL